MRQDRDLHRAYRLWEDEERAMLRGLIAERAPVEAMVDAAIGPPPALSLVPPQPAASCRWKIPSVDKRGPRAGCARSNG